MQSIMARSLKPLWKIRITSSIGVTSSISSVHHDQNMSHSILSQKKQQWGLVTTYTDCTKYRLQILPSMIDRGACYHLKFKTPMFHIRKCNEIKLWQIQVSSTGYRICLLMIDKSIQNWKVSGGDFMQRRWVIWMKQEWLPMWFQNTLQKCLSLIWMTVLELWVII